MERLQRINLKGVIRVLSKRSCVFHTVLWRDNPGEWTGCSHEIIAVTMNWLNSRIRTMGERVNGSSE